MLSTVTLCTACFAKLTFPLNAQLMCLLIIKHTLMKIMQSANDENLNAGCISSFFLDLGLLDPVSYLRWCDLRGGGRVNFV